MDSGIKPQLHPARDLKRFSTSRPSGASSIASSRPGRSLLRATSSCRSPISIKSDAAQALSEAEVKARVDSTLARTVPPASLSPTVQGVRNLANGQLRIRATSQKPGSPRTSTGCLRLFLARSWFGTSTQSRFSRSPRRSALTRSARSRLFSKPTRAASPRQRPSFRCGFTGLSRRNEPRPRP